MKNGVANSSVANLAVVWLVLIVLLYFASGGFLLFQHAALNDNGLWLSYGALGAQRSSESMATLSVSIVVLVLVAPLSRRIVGVGTRERVFTALTMLAIASCLWSEVPVLSLGRALFLLVDTLFAFYLFVRFNPGQQMKLVLILGWISLLSSFVFVVVFPRYGVSHVILAGAWRGIYAQKNSCSAATLVLLPAAFYVAAASLLQKLARITYIGLSILLIVRTQSAMGRITLALLLALAAGIAIVRRIAVKDKLILLLGGVALVAAISATAVVHFGEIVFIMGKNLTLTGRTRIWQAVLPAIFRHPLTGYGYMAFWRGYEGASADVSLTAGWAVTSSHNGFLEVWLMLGLSGLVPVLYSFWRAGRCAFTCLRSGATPSHDCWWICLVFVTLVINADEAGIMTPNNLSWILYVVACAGLAKDAQYIRRKSA